MSSWGKGFTTRVVTGQWETHESGTSSWLLAARDFTKYCKWKDPSQTSSISPKTTRSGKIQITSLHKEILGILRIQTGWPHPAEIGCLILGWWRVGWNLHRWLLQLGFLLFAQQLNKSLQLPGNLFGHVFVQICHRSWRLPKMGLPHSSKSTGSLGIPHF